MILVGLEKNREIKGMWAKYDEWFRKIFSMCSKLYQKKMVNGSKICLVFMHVFKVLFASQNLW